MGCSSVIGELSSVSFVLASDVIASMEDVLMLPPVTTTLVPMLVPAFVPTPFEDGWFCTQRLTDIIPISAMATIISFAFMKITPLSFP
jgi:hypothetical protein